MTDVNDRAVFPYFAFISYSHKDKAWADWLHKALERYAVPSRLVGQITSAGVIPKRLTPIFRDREELASAHDLGSKVNTALAQSANLIVICSPHSAISRWVDVEISSFQQLGRTQRIFCLIVDGEPNASDLPGRETEECFAPALRFQLDASDQSCTHHTEPIAADIRPGKDGKTSAKLKLIAGLLDVGFDSLRQRELQQRVRRMTAIAALAVLVMAVTTVLAINALISRHAAETARNEAVKASHAADIARADAERRQKQAEDLVGFMLGDLSDKLTQVARLDIMEAVDDKAMAYFKKMPNKDVTDEVLQQRAKTLEKIGTVRMDQGHQPAAMTAFQASAQIGRQLADASPQQAERQVAYSRTLTYIGLVKWNQGQLDQAQQSFEHAEQALQQAQVDTPDDPQLIIQLVYLDNNIGHVHESRGKLDEAEAQYEQMLTRCRILLGRKIVETDWTQATGAAHNNLGKLALMRGDLARAIDEYRADDAIEAELSARDLTNNDQLANLMTTRAILGRTLVLTGNLDDGMHNLQEAVDIAKGLTEVDPHQTNFQQSLALYSLQLSRLHRLTGKIREANQLSELSLGIYTTLVHSDPTNTVRVMELAEARIEQSKQSLETGDIARARAQATQAVAVLDPLLARHPDERPTLLATLLARLALAKSSDATAATLLYRTSLSTAEEVRSGNADPRLLALQLEALLGLKLRDQAMPLVKRLWTTGYRDPATLNLLQHEHFDYPANAGFQQRLHASTSAQGPQPH